MRNIPRPHAELSATDDKFLFLVPRQGSGWKVNREWLDAGCPDSVYLDNSPDAQRKRADLDAVIAAKAAKAAKAAQPSLFDPQ